MGIRWFTVNLINSTFVWESRRILGPRGYPNGFSPQKNEETVAAYCFTTNLLKQKLLKT